MSIFVRGIAKREGKREPMAALTMARITKEDGLVGDYKGLNSLGRKRQITLLSAQQWGQTCDELRAALPWFMRRANLLIDGVIFGPEYVGRYVAIGGSLVLEITGETTPCERMDEQHQGLTQALAQGWRGGVTATVLRPGQVLIIDPVHVF